MNFSESAFWGSCAQSFLSPGFGPSIWQAICVRVRIETHTYSLGSKGRPEPSAWKRRQQNCPGKFHTREDSRARLSLEDLLCGTAVPLQWATEPPPQGQRAPTLLFFLILLLTNHPSDLLLLLAVLSEPGLIATPRRNGTNHCPVLSCPYDWLWIKPW